MKKKPYFSGFNTLRFIGAFVVIFGHIEQFKDAMGFNFYYWFPIPAKVGVVLFFTLSGFLISYLLLDERERRGKIDLKNFYLRRAFRILPLYYLIVFLSIFIFNKISILKVPNFSEAVYQNLNLPSILMLIFVLPNFLEIIIPYAAQSWAIGIEEQFYLVQPLLVKLLRNKISIFVCLLTIVFSYEILSKSVDFLTNLLKVKLPFVVIDFIQETQYFGCIAIGCIAGIILFYKVKNILKLLFNKYFQISLLIIFVCLIVINYQYQGQRVIDYRWYALLFGGIIINIASNRKNPIARDNNIFDFLGKISYGLYMYHPVCIGLTLGSLANFSSIQPTGIFFNAIVYLCSIGSTILVSTLSYNYFEGYFLRLKKNFEV